MEREKRKAILLLLFFHLLLTLRARAVEMKNTSLKL